MNVYMLEQYQEYDVPILLGIFSTQEKAEQQQKDSTQGITEVELDTLIEEQW